MTHRERFRAVCRGQTPDRLPYWFGGPRKSTFDAWMKQGLSKRAEASLARKLTELASEVPGGSVIAWSTIALFPLVRYGEVLRDLRDLPARVVLAFPGEERGGKLHYMNQPDGGNYLAVKLSPR